MVYEGQAHCAKDRSCHPSACAGAIYSLGGTPERCPCIALDNSRREGVIIPQWEEGCGDGSHVR